MPRQFKDESKWPFHYGHVDFRREDYFLYRKKGIEGRDVNFFGLLSFIIRGHIIQELYDKKVSKRERTKLEDFDKSVLWEECKWKGGCEDGKASLDFELEIPSDSEDEVEYHKFFVKAEQMSDLEDMYTIRDVRDIIHVCPSRGYHEKIQRFTPCKHNIALQLILQDRSPEWCNRKGGQYAGKHIWKKYDKSKANPRFPDTLLPSQHPISDELRTLYNELTLLMEKKKIKSLEREKILLEYSFDELRDEQRNLEDYIPSDLLIHLPEEVALA